MTEKQVKPKPPKDWVGLQVRIGEDLRQQLVDAAANNKVSMNAELVKRLQQSFLRDDGPVDETTVALLQTFRRAIVKVESATGERWHADRKTYEALKVLIDATYSDFLPPFINAEQILGVSEQLTEQRQKIVGVLGILENYGVISSPKKSLAEIYENSLKPWRRKGDYGNLAVGALAGLSEESGKIYKALLEFGYSPIIDLDKPANQYVQSIGSKSLSSDDAISVRALFVGLVRLTEEYDVIEDQLRELYIPTMEYAVAGRAIARQMRHSGGLMEMVESA